MGGTRKRKLTPADERAAEKVRALWAEFKKKNPGMSQEAAAARAGMTQSAFSQFLLGAVPMRVSPVLKFARLFGVAHTEIRDDLPELRYTAGRETTALAVREPEPDIPSDALDAARALALLSGGTQAIMRELIYMLAVREKRLPARSGRRRERAESYAEFERRIEQAFLQGVKPRQKA